MAPKFALLSSISLASAALAISSSFPRALLPLGNTTASTGSWPPDIPEPEPFNSDNITWTQSNDPSGPNATMTAWSDIWSGAMWLRSTSVFNTLSGVYTVPDVPDGGNTASHPFLSLDGSLNLCNGVSLEVGFSIATNKAAKIERAAWYRWLPDDLRVFNGFELEPGNRIQIDIELFSAQDGIVSVYNIDTGSIHQQIAKSDHALCGDTVAWGMKSPPKDSSVSLSKFDILAIDSAYAADVNGITYNPYGATLVTLLQGGPSDVLAIPEVIGQTLIVRRVGN